MSKYAKLTLDLKEAYQEAHKLEDFKNDGGSANMDATFLTLKYWREDKVLKAIKDAGLGYTNKTDWIGSGYIINTGGGQGDSRVRVRNKFAEVLKEKGYDVLHFDMVD
nr:hypothetical protein [Clostridioides sp.]